MSNLILNGRDVSFLVDPETPLLWVICDELKLTGTKFGCGIGVCGACTVHLNGRAIRSCITPVAAADGSAITTIEGLDPSGAHPLQQAWKETQAPQCGYCQSGQIMQAATLLKDFPQPTDNDFDSVMNGNLCRRMAYGRIRAEMGQHVGTALARILADDLEADWETVQIEHVDSDPKCGTMVTGGSWSVWQSFTPLSQSGAAARIALTEEGARLLGVAASACIARNSVIRAGSRSISYADIVQRGKLTRSYSADQLKAMPVKAPVHRRLIGYETQAIDIPDKTDGSAVYGIDARVDDVYFDSFRSPSVQRVRMAFDGNGKVLAMQHDATAGPGWTNWASECFIDEAAHKLGVDPVSFRLRLLKGAGRNAGSAPNAVGGAARQAAVVRGLAERVNWGSLSLPGDTGLGFATTFGQERDMPTWIACAARAHVDRKSAVVRLEKLKLVADAGTIVHPDGALAQVEGAPQWGASMALHEGTEFIDGQVRDSNLDAYTPMRMAEVPELDIEFLQSTKTAMGLVELSYASNSDTAAIR